MINYKNLLVLVALGMLTCATGTQAQVVSVNSTTFLDESTGLEWKKLDQYFGQTMGQVETEIAGTGFAVADFAQVNTLAGDAGAPVTDAGFDALAAIMGGAYSGGPEPSGRELIWGDYYIGAGDAGWYYMYAQSPWEYYDSGGDYSYPDLGTWVVQSGPATAPDGGLTAAMLGTAMAGLAFIRRKF